MSIVSSILTNIHNFRLSQSRVGCSMDCIERCLNESKPWILKSTSDRVLVSILNSYLPYKTPFKFCEGSKDNSSVETTPYNYLTDSFNILIPRKTVNKLSEEFVDNLLIAIYEAVEANLRIRNKELDNNSIKICGRFSTFMDFYEEHSKCNDLAIIDEALYYQKLSPYVNPDFVDKFSYNKTVAFSKSKLLKSLEESNKVKVKLRPTIEEGVEQIVQVVPISKSRKMFAANEISGNKVVIPKKKMRKPV